MCIDFVPLHFVNIRYSILKCNKMILVTLSHKPEFHGRWPREIILTTNQFFRCDSRRSRDDGCRNRIFSRHIHFTWDWITFGSKRALNGGRTTAVEEEPGMSRLKQRRKVTGNEEEAFPRHTQVSAKERNCCQRPEEVERIPMEAEMPKKWRSRVWRGLMEA